MNFRFVYLYRDAGNNKKWGEIVFSNSLENEYTDVEVCIRKYLIQGEYFVAKEIDLPDLHFEIYDSDEDHEWHEFHSCLETMDSPTDSRGRTIADLIQALKSASKSSME
jgi:hypothetical protein